MGVMDFEYECPFQLNHPLTEEDWNKITDAELEHTDEIIFHTPKGKEVVFVKKELANDSNT